MENKLANQTNLPTGQPPDQQISFGFLQRTKANVRITGEQRPTNLPSIDAPGGSESGACGG